MTTIRALALTATAAVLLAGCGGGGGDRLTREELIEAADAICARYDERIENVEEPQDIEDVEGYIDELAPVIEEGTGELEALEPPEGLEEQYDDWLAAGRSMLDVVDDVKEAAADGDEARLLELIEGTNASEQEADRIAREIGFEDCGAE